MNKSNEEKRCIIIGAGIAGLNAAKILQSAGYDVVVLDKGKVPGGRAATKHIKTIDNETATFDYGAPFFTALGNVFKPFSEELFQKNLLLKDEDPSYVPKYNFRYGSPRYFAKDGMRNFALHLATDLKVITACKVVSLEHDQGHWLAYSEDARSFSAKHLIITIPIPQALSLLGKSNITVEDSIAEDLKSVTYYSTLSLLALYDEKISFFGAGFIEPKSQIVDLIYDNRTSSPDNPVGAVTIHTSHKYAVDHWDATDDQIKDDILKECKYVLPNPPVSYYLHKWKYGIVENPLACGVLVSKLAGNIVFAGDAFTFPNIEGAFLSGKKAAEVLMSL